MVINRGHQTTIRTHARTHTDAIWTTLIFDHACHACAHIHRNRSQTIWQAAFDTHTLAHLSAALASLCVCAFLWMYTQIPHRRRTLSRTQLQRHSQARHRQSPCANWLFVFVSVLQAEPFWDRVIAAATFLSRKRCCAHHKANMRTTSVTNYALRLNLNQVSVRKDGMCVQHLQAFDVKRVFRKCRTLNGFKPNKLSHTSFTNLGVVLDIRIASESTFMHQLTGPHDTQNRQRLTARASDLFLTALFLSARARVCVLYYRAK